MASRITKRVKGRDFTPPSIPANLAALALDPYRIRVTCDNALDGFTSSAEAVSGVVAYQWQQSLEGTSWAALADTAVSEYIHTGLSPSETRYYRVRAMDLAGNLSGFSGSVSATTLPVETVNRPPVWNTSVITVYAYAGQAVSQSLAGYASDPDGDALEFSEGSTAVLSTLGLSISSNGLLSGTIPADAVPQTLTANLVVSDGEFDVTLTAGLTVEVISNADAAADWLARSTADGVFWGCNFEVWVRGIDGYTSQPTKDYPSGQIGQVRTPIADISQVPSSEAETLPTKCYTGDIGDGFGTMRLDTVAGVSGKMLMIREGTLDRADWTQTNVGDWNILPWAFAPLDFRDADQGNGEPNVRYGIPGTCGEGKILPFVETRTNGTVSSYNPQKRPMVRHFFMQWIMRVPAYHYGYMHRLFYQPPLPAGIARRDRDNKIVFVTGGQSNDQYCIKLDHTFLLTAMGYRNGATSGVGGSLEVRVKGRRDITLLHPALRPPGGLPALSSANTAEEWMVARGPAAYPLVYGMGMFPDGVTEAFQELDWYHSEDSRLVDLSLSYADANKLTNSARGFPYGGFPTDGTAPYPGLAWPTGHLSGAFRPDVPHVVQVMLSEQLDEFNGITVAVDDDRNIGWGTGTASLGLGPRITAVWAAPLGDPPKLLFHTGSNGQNGPSMIASRAFHRASGADGATTDKDVATIFQFQENATGEDRSNTGFMVVGALDGFADPAHDGATTVFYAVRANPSKDYPLGLPGESPGSLMQPYVGVAANKNVDPGTVNNFGGGTVMGFATGTLAGVAYRPAEAGKRWQYKILRTEYTEENITVPNAYQGGATNVTGPVHKITLDGATPVLPRARAVDYDGDCFNWITTRDVNKPYGRQIQFGEVLFGLKWIPWPRHLDAAPEWPEGWT